MSVRGTTSLAVDRVWGNYGVWRSLLVVQAMEVHASWQNSNCQEKSFHVPLSSKSSAEVTSEANIEGHLAGVYMRLQVAILHQTGGNLHSTSGSQL